MFLTKHHGLGNDFLIALDETNERALAVDGSLAVQLCDRRRGIGADGLIHGARPTAEQASQGIDVVMSLFNSDGSRAELSGNGARCLGQAVAMARGRASGTITALTDAGLRPLVIASGGGPTWTVSVDMGQAQIGPAVPAPVSERFGGTRWGTIDMGNPHLVVLVDDPGDIDLESEGPWVEKHFVDGMNVEFIRAGGSANTLELRVWERGAGITEACGTGACAAAVAFNGWFPSADETITETVVAMPGGNVVVRLDGGRVTLIGPATFVAEVTVADDRLGE